MGYHGMLRRSLYLWLRLLCFSGVVCLRLLAVDAQTDTPVPTITRTATSAWQVVTFEPGTATETPVAGRFECPDEPVYSRDVSLSYLAQCGHCVTRITATPEQVSRGGLPQLKLPITPIAPTKTPTGIWFPRTSTPSPYLTVYPTITPTWFVSTAAVTPSATLSVTLTPSPTPDPLIIVPVLASGSQVVTNFDVEFEFYNGSPLFTSQQGSSSIEFVQGAADMLGLNIVFDEPTVLHRVVLEAASGSYSCPGGSTCGYHLNALLFHDGDAMVLAGSGSWGYPEYTYSYDLNDEQFFDFDAFPPSPVTSLQILMVYYDTAMTGGFRLGAVDTAYFQNIFLEIEGGVYVPPTATPFISPTPADYVDCRNPATGIEETQVAETTILDGSFRPLSRTCFTLIDPSFVLNLTGLNADWYLDPDDLEVCIVLYALPSFAIFGVQLRLDMLIGVVIVAYLIRLFRSY